MYQLYLSVALFECYIKEYESGDVDENCEQYPPEETVTVELTGHVVAPHFKNTCHTKGLLT